MKKRLIIELLGLEHGKAYGFQEYVFNLLHYFYQHRDDIRYEQIVIWCKNSERGLFSQFEDKFVVESYKYTGYLKKHWLQSWLPISKRLGKDDLLFSPGNISGVLKRCPEILTIHDLLFKRKEWLANRVMRWQREVLLPISIKKANKIVAISQFTKDDLEAYYSCAKGKVEVIYNSFNFDKYNGKKVAEIGSQYFLAISTNADYKNQKTVLKAFEQYRKNGGEKQLVVIGSMNNVSEARTVYESMPAAIKEQIVWKSNVSNEELGALYRGASCFISASKFEGLGMPVVEAMSFGLPVILSDIPVHREVSMCKGDYFEPMDVETLTSMMLNISDTKRAYSDAVHEIFSEENTSAKYVELINRAGGVIIWFVVEDFRGSRFEIQIIAPDCCCEERRTAA